MQTAGIFVGALAEFSAGMKIRQHQLDRRHFPLRMHIDRNSAAIITNGNRTIDVDGHLDAIAMAGQMFVDGIVEHLEYRVMQSAFVRVADIHAWPLAHRFQSFKLVDLRRIVFFVRISLR